MFQVPLQAPRNPAWKTLRGLITTVCVLWLLCSFIPVALSFHNGTLLAPRTSKSSRLYHLEQLSSAQTHKGSHALQVKHQQTR